METIRFEDLELDAKIMRAITDMGFEAASPIQGQAIPLELQGLDIIGQAQTGTGKTAAFGIPLLQKIDPKNKKPQAIPSLDDVTSIKADKILDQVGEVLQDSDLSKVIDIVEKRVLEEDYTTLDLAAALLKMMMGEEGEELLEENRPLRELEDLEDESRRSRGGRNGRGSRGRNEDVARLFINIGKNQGIRPGDILGAIAGESGMPGRMVGSIDMFDNYTFVEVPREHADVVLQAMRGAKIKGKNVHMEKANRK